MKWYQNVFFLIFCIFNFFLNILKNKEGSKTGYDTIFCYSKE